MNHLPDLRPDPNAVCYYCDKLMHRARVGGPMGEMITRLSEPQEPLVCERCLKDARREQSDPWQEVTKVS